MSVTREGPYREIDGKVIDTRNGSLCGGEGNRSGNLTADDRNRLYFMCEGSDVLRALVRQREAEIARERQKERDAIKAEADARQAQFAAALQARRVERERANRVMWDQALERRRAIVRSRVSDPVPEWHDEQIGIEWTPKMQAQEFMALRVA